MYLLCTAFFHLKTSFFYITLYFSYFAIFYVVCITSTIHVYTCIYCKCVLVANVSMVSMVVTSPCIGPIGPGIDHSSRGVYEPYPPSLRFATRQGQGA